MFLAFFGFIHFDIDYNNHINIDVDLYLMKRIHLKILKCLSSICFIIPFVSIICSIGLIDSVIIKAKDFNETVVDFNSTVTDPTEDHTPTKVKICMCKRKLSIFGQRKIFA